MAALSKRQQFLFWTVSAIVAIAGLIAILMLEYRPPAGRHAVYVIGIPEEGAALFFGKKQCAICHAVNGRGCRVAPDLGTIHPGTPATAWLATVLWDHEPGMWRQMGGKTPQLSQEEMAHILAFLYQAGGADTAGDPTAGQRVFSASTTRTTPSALETILSPSGNMVTGGESTMIRSNLSRRGSQNLSSLANSSVRGVTTTSSKSGMT